MASKGPLLNEKQKDVICDGTLIHNKKSPVDAHFFSLPALFFLSAYLCIQSSELTRKIILQTFSNTPPVEVDLGFTFFYTPGF